MGKKFVVLDMKMTSIIAVFDLINIWSVGKIKNCLSEVYLYQGERVSKFIYLVHGVTRMLNLIRRKITTFYRIRISNDFRSTIILINNRIGHYINELTITLYIKKCT